MIIRKFFLMVFDALPQSTQLWMSRPYLLWWASGASVLSLSRRLGITRVRHLHNFNQVYALWLFIISLHGFLRYNVLGMTLPFSRYHLVSLTVCCLNWLLIIVCVCTVMCLLWSLPCESLMGNSSVTHVTFFQFFYFYRATIKHLVVQSNKCKAYGDLGVQFYITTQSV